MAFESDIKSIERKLFDLESKARDLDPESVSASLQKTLETIAGIAQRIKDHLEPKPWARLRPHERVSRIVRAYRKAQEEGEEVPIKVAIADNIYSMRLINHDQWTLFRNDENIYATADNVGPYALGELFLAMESDWAKIEEADGRENPGDLIDKVIFEVICANLIENNTVITGENRESLIKIVEDLTGHDWNTRQV